jgi:2-polyprenyl-3-methyl-5-hydroxy-6-metoxy-1,4-benzoquinol methylase
MMLITPEYRELNRKLHATNPVYGVSGFRYVDAARRLSQWGRLDILDYGCGKAVLAEKLGPAYRVTNYDPCIEGLDTPPEPHDVVMCTDVMEHVEPEFIMPVLKDIRRLTREFAFFVVSTEPAQKVLEDGRNAHISLHPPKWWLERMEEAGFEVLETIDDDGKHLTFGAVLR